MHLEVDVGSVRDGALDRIEKGQRRFKLVIAMAGLIEMAGLLTYLVLMDFGNTLHWLVLIGSLLVYGVLSTGMIALGVMMNTNTQRVLRAIQMSSDGEGRPL